MVDYAIAYPPYKKTSMIQFKNIFFLVSVLFISSCGYHLRGGTDLTEQLKSIYLEGGSSELRRSLKKTLKSSSGLLVANVDTANIVIQITNENMDRRSLSLNERGRINEYELIYSLYFSMMDPTGELISKAQKIEVSRDYFNNQDDLLGKNNEEKVIRKEMYRQISQSILRRAKAILDKKNN